MKKIKTYNIGKNTTFDLTKLCQDLEKGTYTIKTQAVSIYGNKSPESTGLSYFVDPLNPLHLPPFTIRCKFSTAGQPTPPPGGGSGTSAYDAVTWDSVTQVDSDGYIWDITKNSSDWSSLLREETTLVEVLGANSTGVTIIAHIFRACSNLSSVSLFDTSSVTTTESMFNGCYLLETIPLFNISSCLNTRLMFSNCTSLVHIPLIDTHNSTTFQQMFYNCTSLKTIPQLDASNCLNMNVTFAQSAIEYLPALNTSKVTTMRQTFLRCYNLKSIRGIDTSSVTDMYATFAACESLIELPQFLDTSKCTNMLSLFSWCKSLVTAPSMDTSKVTNMSELFQHCWNLESVGTYDASSATTIERMYAYCEKLKRVNPMPVKSGCNMSRVFDTLVESEQKQFGSSLEEIPNWDWTKASTLAKVFRGCTALTSIPDMGVPTNATTCESMFENCSNISSGITRAYNNLSSSSSITTYTSTFKNCGSNTTTGSAELAQIPEDWGGTYVPVDPYNPLGLPPFTIRCKFSSGYTPLMGDSQTLVDAGENVWDIYKDSTDWSDLFHGNRNVIAILGANTTDVVDMTWMFGECSSLTTIPLFNTAKAFAVASMFRDCTSVASGALALYQHAANQVTPPMYHDNAFKNCGSNTQTGAAELAQIPTDWGGTMK